MKNILKSSHRIVILILFLSLVMFSPAHVYAQDIKFYSEVNTNKISLTSALKFMITVEGTQNLGEIENFEIEGFDVQYIGPTTSMTFINGKSSKSKALNYSLFPLKTGTFTIPSIRATINGRVYTTEPINIEVIDSSQSVIEATRDNSVSTLEDKIFLVLKTPKTDLYVNERLPVKILLFVSDLSVRDVQYPNLSDVGFITEDYAQPKQYSQAVQGVRYDIVEFDTVIYPTRTGQIKLGPATLQCNILMRSQDRRSPFSWNDSFFDDDFFGTVFNRQERRPITLSSLEVDLNVKELPKEDQPEDFSGAVGNFNFDVSVNPTDIKVGDPITVRMEISGSGHLKTVDMPELIDDENLKVYEPSIKEERGVKYLEQVVIPKAENVLEIPAFKFHYFDPDLGKYQTITKGPFPIKVTEFTGDSGINIVGLQEQNYISKPEILGQDIVFIKDDPGKLRLKNKLFYRSFSYYMFLLLFSIFWIGTYIYLKKTQKLETDVRYARKYQAPKQAKKGLKQAKLMMTQNKGSEFYDIMFKTLQQYLGNKFHLSSGTITFESIRQILSQQSISENILNKLEIVFNECDRIRYASAQISIQEMNSSFRNLEEVIDYLERHVK